MAVSEKKHQDKAGYVKSLLRPLKKAKSRHHNSSLVAKKTQSDASENLTATRLNALANEAFTEAAKETMKVLGYNVSVENGELVKIFNDGTSHKIGTLPVHKKLTKDQISKAFEI
jgi:hypothetical protein